jgi:superfamily II DNA helicase RecQ
VILSFNIGNDTSVVIFCSPQAFTCIPVYRSLLAALLSRCRLHLVCVDELHLFVQFGLWFRSEFSALRSILFDKLKSGDDSTTTSHVPILFMSATCDKATVEQLTLLTGFTFTADNVFWPSILGMQQRRFLEYSSVVSASPSYQVTEPWVLSPL